MAEPDSTIIVNIEKGPKKEGRQFAAIKKISGFKKIYVIFRARQ